MGILFSDICGIDEVGRGPLAGPVMAACVFIPAEKRTLPFFEMITDSKKLSAKKREYLYDHILEHCQCGIAEASAQEIDALNIHHATLLAMKRAYEVMVSSPSPCFRFAQTSLSLEGEGKEGRQPRQGEGVKALVDGKFCPDLPCPAEAVVKGDSKHVEIAAASIIAKVTRDRLMAKLHDEFPYYGWYKNAGYGTAEHRAGIEKHGITKHHRKSFAPCSSYKVA